MRNTTKAVLAIMAVTTLFLSSCKAGDSAGGVSDSTIKLGNLTDLSGLFAPTGKDYTSGMQLAVEKVNAGGGVCDRDLELVTKDHGYDVQKAVLAYDETRSDVAMYSAVFGSAVTAALRDKLEADKMLAVPVSYSSNLLGVDNLVVIGATYDVMAINSLSYAVDKGLIAKGDQIGELYLEGELGDSVHQGTEWAADQLGLHLTAHQVKPTDTDFGSQISDLRRKGVKLIMLSTTGSQTATVAAVAESSGLNVPLIGAGPTWNNSLFDTDAAGALKKNYYRASVTVGLDDPESPAAMHLTEKWKADHQGEKVLSGTAVVAGYTSVMASVAILEKTCDDLSPAAILKAREDVAPFDVDGLMPSQDITDPSKPASLSTVIERPDENDLDGVTVVEKPFVSPLVEKYAASK